MGPWPDERFAVWRPVTRYACGGGANLASDAAFDAQRQLAERVLLWYRQYPDLLRKLSKRAPAVVDLFCGGGGCSEGIRRAGMLSSFAGLVVDWRRGRVTAGAGGWRPMIVPVGFWRDLAYCGWNLKEHERDMQEHYAGEDRLHRVMRRKITQKG